MAADMTDNIRWTKETALVFTSGPMAGNMMANGAKTSLTEKENILMNSLSSNVERG
jgi:hypothetical protein